MLEKSLTSDSDTLIYDLEDSVAPSQKESARHNLVRFLGASQAEQHIFKSFYQAHNRLRKILAQNYLLRGYLFG